MNHELADVQAGFSKGRGARDQIANMHWIIEKAREFKKNICSLDYAKAFDFVDHSKLWKILKQIGIPDHLICLLRNLYAYQEAIVRTWNNGLVPNWERSTLRPYFVTCLFNLYAEYIMRNARLDEAQARIKVSGRNINILKYADDTTLMAESEEELKSLLMKVKEGTEKLAFQHSKTKIMASSPITSWQIIGEKMETLTDFIFFGF